MSRASWYRLVLYPPVVAPRAVGSSGGLLGRLDTPSREASIKGNYAMALILTKTALGVITFCAALLIWIAAVFVCHYLFGEYGFVLPALVYAWVLGDWIYEDYLVKTPQF